MSSPELQASVVAGCLLGKKSYYFGCWKHAGHHLHDPFGRRTYESNHPKDIPWDLWLMDATLLQNGKIPDIPDGKVYWTCGGKDGFWYAFYWWDRSVDTRGNANSGFYVRGFGYPEAQDAFDYACTQFPNVVRRQIHPLALQVNWREDRKASK